MIELVIFDLDGVFCDKIYFNINNNITKSFNPKDTYSLKLLNNNNIKIMIFTGSNDNLINNFNLINNRIDYFINNCYNKKEVLNKFFLDNKYDNTNTAYLGDDIFDSDCKDLVKIFATPKDGCLECKSVSNYICKNKGGDGCVREFVEYIINYNKIKFSEISSNYLTKKFNTNDIFKIYSTLKYNSTHLELLDCTLRDGGYINDWNFSSEFINDYLTSINNSGIEYIELGFIDNNFKGSIKSLNEEYINLITKDYNLKYCAMILLQNIKSLNIKLNKISMLRILLNIFKEEINNDDINHIINLHSLGYQICINLGYGDKMDESMFLKLSEKLTPLIGKIKYLYLADTFGSYHEIQLYEHMNFLRKYFNKFGVIFGFHGHNNCLDAISKSYNAYELGFGIIDGTIFGLGRGSGNTNIELFMEKINIYCNNKYNNKDIFKFGLKHIYSINNKLFSFSNSPLYYLSGINSIHPDFIKDILDIDNISIERIINFIEKNKGSKTYFKLDSTHFCN